ncbi:MAG: murein biosynthesis integral membrane protein MurJ, partial [Cellvibrionaceae bacterium]|nr:murein biosynthesis integral membrane protein MurJ [Cellvibrionaceae bacterium]
IRITFPYLMLVSLTGFAGAILNSYDRFAVPAFTPVLLNICLISAAVFLAPQFDPPVMALAWGVFAAGVVQLIFQLPFLHGLRLLPYPRADWRDPGVRKILKLMAPAIFGVSVSQINLLLDTVLASLLPVGSVSWLYFSDRLVELPLGVFGIAVATVILPNLSRQHSGERKGEFSATLDWALRVVLLIAVPSALALMVLAEEILTTLFQYGKYSPRDITMAAWSLRAYALGLVAFMLIKVLAPGYFSRQDIKTPVKYGIIAMVANMLLNVAFVWPLYTYLNLGHVGLALATSGSALLNGWLLYRGLRRLGVYRPSPGWGAMFMRLALANGLMLALLLWLAGEGQAHLAGPWWERAIYMAVLVLAGIVVYALSLLASGLRPRHLMLQQRQ